MLKVRKLIQNIDRGLSEGNDPISMRQDAIEFASICKSANERLDQCDVLIAGEQEHNAVSLAEVSPPLLELVGQLMFHRSVEWREFCRANELPSSDPINADAARRLNAIYGNIQSGDHKVKEELFGGYRAAVLERRDEDALAAIRTINKLFPNDRVAASQLLELEEKIITAKLDELGTLLKGGKEAATAELLTALEQDFPDLGSDAGVLNEAFAIRMRLDIERARRDCSAILEKAADCKSRGNLAAALDKLGLVLALQRDFEFELAPEAHSLFSQIQDWGDEETAKEKRTEEFRSCVDILLTHVEIVSGKSLRSKEVKLPELEEDRTRLLRHWNELDRFGRAVAEEVERAVTKCAASLNSEIKRKKRIRKMTLIYVGTFTVCVGIFAAGYMYFLLRANSKSAELYRLREAGEYSASVKLLEDIREGNAFIRRFSSVSGAVAEMEAWQKSQRAKADSFFKEVALLTDEAEGGFADIDSRSAAQVDARINGVTEMQEAVAADLRLEADAALAATSRKWGSRLQTVRQSNIERFEELYPVLEQELRDIQRLDPFSAEMRKRVEVLTLKVTEFELLVDPGISSIGLPEAFDEIVAKLKERLAEPSKVAAQWEDFDNRLRQTRKLDDYQKLLGEMATAAGSQAAAVAKEAVVSEDVFAQRLFLPRDPGLWAVFADSGFKANVHPDPAESIPDAEKRILRRLRDSDASANIYLYSSSSGFENAGGGLPAYSKGEIAKGEPRTVAGVRKWGADGSLYLPWKHPTTAIFEDIEWIFEVVGTGIVGKGPPQQIGLSKESASLANLKLGNYYDERIEYYQAKSLLVALDSIIADEETNPLFKAFLHGQLASLVQLRDEEWGAEWTSLKEDYQELKRILSGPAFNESSWMIPEANKRLKKFLTRYYEKIGKVSYAKQASVLPHIVGGAARAGFSFIGYADAASNPVLQAGVVGIENVWGFRDDREAAQLFVKGKSPNEWISSGKESTPLPFSPLFTFNGDLEEIFKSANIYFGAVSKSATMRSRLSPFFTN